MSLKKYYISLLTLIILFSCERVNKLSETEKRWMPYKGGETLIFSSNTGATDTLFVLRIDTLLGYPEPLSPFGIEYEILSAYCKYGDTSKGQHQYLEHRAFEIRKGKDKRAVLGINFSLNDAVFYRDSRIRLDSLDNTKQIILQAGNKSYNDVYVFNGEDMIGYSMRSDFITKVYWSKAHGLIRYDKKDSVYWELTKKY